VTGAAIQRFGDSARRVARGPGSKNADISVFKNTWITERYMLQFRAEFFNFTNTPTFFLPAASSPTLTCIGAPGAACNASNATFGKLTSRPSQSLRNLLASLDAWMLCHAMSCCI